MAAVYSSKSGQIPAFGDWETANELPQYFECARQAGLLRCSCSGECPASAPAANADLYGFVFDDHRTLPRRVYAAVSQRKTHPHSNRHIKNQESTAQRKSQGSAQKLYSMQKSSITVKPVDEDLYKIPPEFLHNCKRKKMLGFFSRCIDRMDGADLKGNQNCVRTFCSVDHMDNEGFYEQDENLDTTMMQHDKTSEIMGVTMNALSKFLAARFIKFFYTFYKNMLVSIEVACHKQIQISAMRGSTSNHKASH